MQTDLQLLLLIIGLVFGGFILYNTFKNKGNKRVSTFDEYEKPTTTSNHDVNDPLLDDFTHSTKHDVLESSITSKAKSAFDEMALEVAEPLFVAESTPAPAPVVAPQPVQAAVAEPLFDAPKPVVKTKVTKPVKNEFIALSIIPKSGSFTGAMLIAALKANQFHYGEHKIFHRHVDDNPKASILFSIASLVEPGNFDYHQMLNKTYPGILLWMMLPVSIDAMQGFDKLLKSARQLASFLNGELCDTKRLVLTTEAIATIRERVHQFQVAHEELEYELEDVR